MQPVDRSNKQLVSVEWAARLTEASALEPAVGRLKEESSCLADAIDDVDGIILRVF